MGGDLIREARLRARLTQRELAERLSTTQSAVARWEGGGSEPSFALVMRAVRAAGFSVDIHLEPDDGSDLAQARRLLAVAPAERLAVMTADARHLLRLQAEAMASLRAG